MSLVTAGELVSRAGAACCAVAVRGLDLDRPSHLTRSVVLTP
ncbi:hypothetical protein ACWDBW_10615 [Streptomyces sp. NPDC001107]